MKKQVLTTCAIAAISLLAANDSYGQPGWSYTTTGTGGTGNHIISNSSTDYVGIGDNDPQDKLSVNGNFGFTATPGIRHFYGRTDDGVAFFSKGTWADGSGILLQTENTMTGNIGQVSLLSTATGSDIAFRFVDQNWNYRMTIDGNSNMEIGGDFSFSPHGINRHIYGNTDGALAIFSKDSWSNGSGIMFNGIGANTTIDLVSNAGGSNPAFRLVDQNWHPKLIVDGSGNTEIGGNYTFRQDVIDRKIMGNTTSALWIHSNTDLTNGSAILMGSNSGPHPGSISFMSQAQSAGSLAFRFVDPQWNNKLVIQGDGQVVIGNVPTVSASDYKLYVETGILTEKIKVATVNGGNWSDFVFADNYELKSLNDVQNFIAQNKHLPDVPSACEVEENGYDLTKMDATLLQKIEELTLYIIQQQKEIEELKNGLNK